MPNNINVFTSNFQTTGINRTVPQVSLDITVNWTDDQQQAHTTTQNTKWPDILTNAAIPAGWNADQQKAVMLAALRIIAGLDS